MKKVQIVCVGRIKEKYFTDAIAEYAKRLSRYCDFSVKELPDCADEAGSVDKESLSILDELDGYVILTDIGGQLSTSVEVSDIFEKAFISCPKIQLVIGGSRGVNDGVRRRADKRISFGKMTFPHQLMRVIAAEQIYRAFTISAGTAYHK